MTDADAIRIKQMRKTILSNLNMMYPTGLRLDSLYRTVLGFDLRYDEQLFGKDVTYLKEKGYIEFIDEMIGGAGEFMKKVAKLSARGKEIADRTQRDPALEI